MSGAMQYASGYSLDLYCDQGRGVPAHPWDKGEATFFGETFAECSKEARKAGWRIFRTTRTARCPACNRKPRP